MSKLDKGILKIIRTKTNMSEQAVRNAVSDFKTKNCPRATQNAAAQLFAQSRGFSVIRKLRKEDKNTLPSSLEIEKPLKIKQNNNKPKQKRIISFINYQTTNKFLKLHFEEVNRCYTNSCYTATFILIRKIIENLITDIIKKKFPGKSRHDKEIYLNLDKGHIRDLSELIINLRNKSRSFVPDEKKLVQRILQLAEEFKDDANDKTHSLYHISSKKELEDKNPQQIFDLIKEYFDKY